jgi:hypothetical protein
MEQTATMFTLKIILSGELNSTFTLGSGILALGASPANGNLLATSNIPKALRYLADQMESGEFLK